MRLLHPQALSLSPSTGVLLPVLFWGLLGSQVVACTDAESSIVRDGQPGADTGSDGGRRPVVEVDAAEGGDDADTAGVDAVVPTDSALPLPDAAPEVPDAVLGVDTTDAAVVPPPEPLPYGGPPVLTRVWPQVVVDDGVIYLEGERLTRPDDDHRDTVVWVVPLAGGRIDVAIVDGRTNRVAVAVPADYTSRLGDRGTIVLRTPDGEDAFQPVFATSDYTFSGKSAFGAGALGNVFRLRNGTRALPNMLAADACTSQPDIVSDATTPCPFSSLVAAQINVPEMSFEVGFPGLGGSLVEWFGIAFEGYLQIPTAGAWRFRVCSDDGSRLFVWEPGDVQRLVVDNDGQHSMACREGTVTLPGGPNRFALEYFQGPRTEIGIQLFWQGPAMSAFEIVPEDALRLFRD